MQLLMGAFASFAALMKRRPLESCRFLIVMAFIGVSEKGWMDRLDTGGSKAGALVALYGPHSYKFSRELQHALDSHVYERYLGSRFLWDVSCVGVCVLISEVSLVCCLGGGSWRQK